MNSFNPSNPNPNNPNPNQPNFFSSPAYTPAMDPSWGSPQFTFSGFQQSPNGFSQMSQVQQLQQYQALQQLMQRNSVPNVLPAHEIERPGGRDKAKKEAARKRKGAGSSGGGGSGGGGCSKASSKMDELISEFRSFKDFAAEKYSHKKNVSADYARVEDFRIMRLNLDSVPEDEREVYRRMKEEMKK